MVHKQLFESSKNLYKKDYSFVFTFGIEAGADDKRVLKLVVEDDYVVIRVMDKL